MAMATTTTTTTTTTTNMTSPSVKLPKERDFTALRSHPQCPRQYPAARDIKFCCTTTIHSRNRSSITCSSSKQYLRSAVKPVSAVGSGLEASITDPEDNDIRIENAKIVVESQDDAKIQVRVDVAGEETRIVFEKILTNLARTAPPAPGFRRQKGGKTSKVPKDFLLQIIGEERVTNFVIQEIVSSTLANYAKKGNLTVKDNKINTIQTAEELRSLFVPGNEFGFSATLELEKSTTETSSSSAAQS